MTFGGHEVLVICGECNALKKDALVGFTGGDDAAILAAIHKRGIGVQAQATLYLALAMAANTVGVKDRMDVLGVERAVVGFRLSYRFEALQRGREIFSEIVAAMSKGATLVGSPGQQ